MPPSFSTRLPHRGVLSVSGADRVSFLNGLVTNDIAPADQGHPVWTAFLTPQGKVIADFFVVGDGERLLLETDLDRLEDLKSRLGRYRLRAKVTLDILSDWGVSALSEQAAVPGGIVFPDPRHPKAGFRALGPASALPDGDATPWQHHRLALGLPEGADDLAPEQGFALEYGFGDLKGIDYRKGCFIGQETTARMKWKHLTRKRLLPVQYSGPALPSGTPITDEGGAEVGLLRSSSPAGDHDNGEQGIALLRLAPVRAGTQLWINSRPLTVHLPDWVQLPPVGEKA